ncbi:GTPase Era [Rhodospirillum centenum]|uniref:GTPase Era n=1 Tax=Rhodospirillum centenum (strain ATCC 51521 / SW) TaxID=414684 RepID=B6IN00_RHOCS|nr:GTPase Era [Rhodospirillum centenum]ACI98897.1 GTP-binding protein Era [Rhodospirillum centenum SW]
MTTFNDDSRPEDDLPDDDFPEEGEEAFEDDTDDDGEDGTPEPEHPRCGFIALVGAPNAGKSTLLNALVGAKVSIVSPKVQTTRSRVLGIGITGDSQLLFVDTPGIFKPKRRLDRAMVAAAWQGATDADLIVMLYDASNDRLDEDTLGIIERLKEAGRTAILALNKVDLIKREKLLKLAAELDSHGIFTRTFMISALTGDGLADLSAFLAAEVPEGPWLYPADQLSDMPERLLAAEVTREKLFLQLHQELPYAATVETESWEEFDDGSVKISQVIYVQRDGQKAIVLGKGGSRIKHISTAARQELETMMDRRVHLFLFVKVRENWVDDPERYRDWGLDYNA